ncbi:MAG TPA: hypothetical protein VGI32_05830 [Steroidobacteraceae bacterium]|jgi:hypothetical protein
MQVPNANVRSSNYYIAETQARCAKCGRQARVLALAVPPNHEIQVDGEWQNAEGNALIFEVAALPDAVSRHLLVRSPAFRPHCGQDLADSRWLNHCEHCAEPFSDDELHCEPGGFMPSSAAEAEAIFLSRIDEGFSACAAGYAFEPEFFALMRRR